MKFKAFRGEKISGFSLMEILISISLFILIILSATDIFRLVIAGQQKAIAAQNLQESMKYFLEAVDKEVRMAKKESGTCASYFTMPSATSTYALVTAPNSNGNALVFRNFYDECVMYYLGTTTSAGRFIVRRNAVEGPISPTNMNITALNYSLQNYSSSSLPIARPLVVMELDAKTYLGTIGQGTYRDLASIKMQTSLTSRYYR